MFEYNTEITTDNLADCNKIMNLDMSHLEVLWATLDSEKEYLGEAISQGIFHAQDINKKKIIEQQG